MERAAAGSPEASGPGDVIASAPGVQVPADPTVMSKAHGNPPAAGDLIEVVPDRLVAGGDAMARLDGFPLFVRGMFPGDRARVRVTEAKPGFARGAVEELLEPGPERRAEPCPVADWCGGCDWTALRLDRQIHWKREILHDSLRRIGKFDIASLPTVAVHPSPLNYRLRSRLQVSEDRAAVGFFSERTHKVVPLPAECEVVGPAVIDHREAIYRQAAGSRATAIDTLENGEELLVHLRTESPTGAPASQLSHGPWTWKLSVASFFQVNRYQIGTLIDLVMKSAEAVPSRGTAWDLYGGVGFFALPLSSLFDKVVTVESSEESHRWARTNAREYPGVRPIRSDVGQFLRRERTMADFVLLDPPRAGLDAEVVRGAAGSGTTRICYLSCDPVTFSRDAQRLARLGWNPTSIDLIDLFPNTHHIETLASFVREG